MMTLISQNICLGVQTVLSHPLGLIPQALAASDDILRKTNKRNLGDASEKLALLTDEIPWNSLE